MEKLKLSPLVEQHEGSSLHSGNILFEGFHFLQQWAVIKQTENNVPSKILYNYLLKHCIVQNVLFLISYTDKGCIYLIH